MICCAPSLLYRDQKERRALLHGVAVLYYTLASLSRVVSRSSRGIPRRLFSFSGPGRWLPFCGLVARSSCDCLNLFLLRLLCFSISFLYAFSHFKPFQWRISAADPFRTPSVDASAPTRTAKLNSTGRRVVDTGNSQWLGSGVAALLMCWSAIFAAGTSVRPQSISSRRSQFEYTRTK